MPTGRAPGREIEALVAEARRGVAEAESHAVPVLRRVRRELSRKCARVSPETILAAAGRLLDADTVPRWLTYELIHHHGPTMSAMDVRTMRRLGRGIASWGDVDAFATLLAGPAWRE